MRKLYLLRHGEPLFLNGKQCCIGCLDLELSSEGKRQANMLGRYFSARPISYVWCSTLLRSRQTALSIAAATGTSMRLKYGLTEVAVGDWEGLTFEEIKTRWPEHYMLRGQDPVYIPPPGGEPFPDALQRFNSALQEILRETAGDIAVVAHSGVNRAFLCAILGKDMKDMFDIKQPYGCVNVIEINDGNKFSANQIGIIPDAVPDEYDCQRLMDEFNVSVECIKHCKAVAAKAESIFEALPEKYRGKLDTQLLRASALLHDIAKGQSDHPRVGAAWVEQEGYPLVADVIASHHWLDRIQLQKITEHSILFLADKQINGEREENLYERFAISLAECGTDQAKKAHQIRYWQAMAVSNMIDSAIKKGSGNAVSV